MLGFRLQPLFWLLFGALRADQGQEVLEFVLRDSSSSALLDNAILEAVEVSPKTVHASIRPTRHTAAASILTYRVNSSFLYLGVRDYSLEIAYNNEVYAYDVDLPLGEWRHIALVLGSSKLNELYLDGYRQRPMKDKPVKISFIRTNESDFFRIGASSSPPGNITFPTASFIGSVAHVQVWGIPLNETQVKTLCKYHELQERLNNTLSYHLLDISSWKSSGGLSLHTLDHSELCATKSERAVITSSGNCEQHAFQCHLINGTLLRGENVSSDDVQLLNTRTNCVVEDLFVSWLVEEEVRDNTLTDVCPVLLSNGSVSNRPCLRSLPCSLCVTTSSPKFTLFGDIQLFDRIYYLQVTAGGNISFKGVASSTITREGSRWVLKSSVHDDLWESDQSSLPIGRKIWVSKGTEKTLAFVSCGYHEFSCDDGNCIPMRQKCNAREECTDESDEVECKNLFKGDIRAPVQEEIINVTFLGVIYNMYDLTPEQPILSFNIDLYLSWNDPRNVYGNLKQKYRHVVDCDSIWTPKITYLDGYGMVTLHDDVKKGCNVYGLGKSNKSLSDPYMTMKVSGRDTSVYYSREALVRTPCLFNFASYPFDRQQCNFSILFDRMGGVFRIENMSNVIYQRVTRGNLREYKLVNVTSARNRNEDQVDVVVHLEKFAGYHITVSFAPTLLMLMISLSTYIFPVENFNERIMVSLISLLVLAALFTQNTEASVKTPNLKLIDIWYAVIILICAFINVSMTAINVIVEREKQRLSSHGRESSSDCDSNQSGKSPSDVEIPSPRQRRFTSKLCNQVAFVFAVTSSLVFFIVYYCLAIGYIEIQS